MNNFNFEVYIYGDTQQISPVLSKARVRIFYKGLNRNYTYITDEFAEKLLNTLPYTPVIGKFEDDDFTNHGRGEQLQVYGIVPETTNLAWEEHLDDDGVTRTYACCDVLLFTARFPEAKLIVGGTAQSMELYDKSIKGDWVYQDGKKFFKFEDGCFIGLCALGKNTEPCFEGAAFYEYAESLKEIVEELKKYQIQNGGTKPMDFKFKLSDSQKLNAIFELINSDNETDYIENIVCDVYDDYALCYNYLDSKYFRAYYTKNDNDDSVVITEKVDAYVLDVTEKEYEVLKKLEEVNGSFEALEKFSNVEEAPEEPETDFEAAAEDEVETEVEDETDTETEEVDEVEETEETETEEIETPAEEPENEFELKITQYENQILELQKQIDTYKIENENLSNYKLGIENKEKENILSKYSTKLPKDIVADFKAKMEEFSVADFKKEVYAKVLEVNENDFLNPKEEEFLPNGSFSNRPAPQNGAERILEKYLKKHNKID